MVSQQKNVVIIIQARMGSTRLPGKVLRDIAGKPMLQHIIERLRCCRIAQGIVLATTTLKEDDRLEDFAREFNLSCYQGETQDVLARYYGAATRYGAEVIVRICADDPLIDPQVVDQVIGEHLGSDSDYTSNAIENTFPLGLNTEVFNYNVLEKAHREASKNEEREHVTPYIWRHPEIFKLHNVANDADYSYLRWTIDTEDDLAFVRKIYEHFPNNAFSWKEVLHLLEMHPEWLEINRHVKQKTI